MIETLVTVLHILTCLALILAILLQSGKGGGVSAAFGGGAGQALGQRGATTVLGRFTGIASATFMVTSMILAVYSTSEYRDETLRDIPAAEETEAKKDTQDKKAKPKSDAKAKGKKDGDKAKTAQDKAAPKKEASEPKTATPATKPAAAAKPEKAPATPKAEPKPATP